MTSNPPPPPKSPRIVARFVGNERAAAAAEFALLLPFLLILYTGAIELLDDITVNRKVALIAQTVTNIVSQYTTISTSSQLPDIFAASSAVMMPYTGKVTIVVSCIAIDSKGKATVSWSQSVNGTARTAGSTVTVPTALAVANTSLVLGEASYKYTPFLDLIKIGALTFSASNYISPRSSTAISLAS
jgi:Flp pilus assembly protein TadG